MIELMEAQNAEENAKLENERRLEEEEKANNREEADAQNSDEREEEKKGESEIDAKVQQLIDQIITNAANILIDTGDFQDPLTDADIITVQTMLNEALSLF